MARKLLLAFLVTSVITVAGAGFAQTRAASSPIKGIWRIVASGPADHMVQRDAIGMSGMVIFGDSYWLYGTETGDAPRKALPQSAVPTASADELRAAWQSFDLQGGPYTRRGTELELKHIISKGVGAYSAPASAPLVVSFKVDSNGKTGTITQVRGAQGPFPNPVTWKIERLE